MKVLGKSKLAKEVNKAAKIIRGGGVVIFPTDTVYGVGCRFDREAAVKRIYQIKQKPKTEPLPILVDSVKQVRDLGCQISKPAKILIKKFWPGALTIILNCGDKRIGVRQPNHPVPKFLAEKVGPIIGTSANFHRSKSVAKFSELDPNFIKLADFVVKGECLTGIESTVVDATVEHPKILRQGAVRLSEL